MVEPTSDSKIDCSKLKNWLLTFFSKNNTSEAKNTDSKEKIMNLIKISQLELNKYTNITIHNSDNEKLILDLRTYICANGNCNFHNNRQHRRLTTYNFNKMISTYIKINIRLENITKEIIYIWLQDTEKKNIPSLQYMNFVKETASTNNNKSDLKSERYKPIEMVFTKIDNMVEENSIRAINNSAPSAPLDRGYIQPTNYRMSYGDINYLGANKAIFYFDRGIRGKQIFTNSMDSIKKQPKHKDIVVIDEIVFVSNCKCDSAHQHRKMFPHYRVTCAVGLTCPARLNRMERLIYARDKNAILDNYTTARSMLIRYW